MNRRLPRWISLTPSLEQEILEDWAQFENVDFAKALQFNPSPDQVRAWLTAGNQIPYLAETEKRSTAEEVETEEVDSDLEIEEAPKALSTIMEHEAASHSASMPELTSKASKLSIGTGNSLGQRIVAHSLIEPSTPATTHSSSARAFPSQTPGSRRRSHATARKFFLAFLHAHDKVECAITLGFGNLECAHLLPKATKNYVTGRIEWAIGGRFCINSRVNYILLSLEPHAELDAHKTLIYPTQRVVLNAVDTFLSWLDGKDGGTPWNQQTLFDYWSFLRSAHPILSDGHQYEIRYIAIQYEAPLSRAARLHVIHRDDDHYTPFAPPYVDFPPVITFANPIFITLNALQHLDHVYSPPWEQRTTEQSWLEWIRAEPKLNHFQNGSLDQEFASFLSVAAHLCRRLGNDFTWIFKKGGKSPTTVSSEHSGNPFHDDASDYSATGSGTSGSNADASSGRSRRKGGRYGGSRDQADSCALTALSTSSDASDIAAAWRAKNVEGDTLRQSSDQTTAASLPAPEGLLARKSHWSKVFRDGGASKDMSDDSLFIKDPDSQSLLSLAGVRKVFGSMVNRVV